MFFNRRYHKLARLDGCWDQNAKLQLFVHGPGHDYYTESGSDGCVKIKAWLKIVVQKKPKPGDRLFSILYHGEYGRSFWIYFLLPSRVD